MKINKQNFSFFKTEKVNYGLYGALFGLLFPIGGTILQLVYYNLDFTFEQIIRVQSTEFLLWIIDSAPFVIGWAATFAGSRQDYINRENLHLSMVAQKTDNIVIITDKSGIIEWVNNAFNTITGFSSEEVVGTRGDMMRSKGKRSINPISMIVIEANLKKTTISHALKNVTKKGESYWVNSTATPIINNKNEVEKIIIIESDITLIKKTESKLKEAKLIAENAQKAEERFIANMSHEIRNPLNGIIGLVYLLNETSLSDKQRDYLDSIKVSSDNLLKIINGVLDFSKIQQGKIEFENSEFSIDSILDNVVHTLHGLSEEKGVGFSAVKAQNVPELVSGDPTRLTQILINIAGNAIKFTNEGYVKIKVEVKADLRNEVELLFTVTDTGIGIPKDKINSVFESYKQASCTTVREYGGTGLGLSIVKQLVELQGGHLSVESVVGKGSIFSFILRYGAVKKPVKKDDKEISANSKKVINNSYFDNMKVLVVEDNKINTLIAKDILTSWKIKTDTAGNGQICIDKLKKNEYDLILMDVNMPVMGGLEATTYIRTKLKSPKKEVPILAMTASIVKENLAECLQVGMNDYITKPFKPDELFSKIARFALKRNTNNRKLPMKKYKQNGKKTFDFNMLLDLPGTDKELVNQVVGIFKKEAPVFLNDLHHYLEKNDWMALSTTAHKMKSPAMWLGIKKLGDSITQLEAIAKGNPDPQSLGQLVDEIDDICNTVLNEMRGKKTTLVN